MPDLDRFYREAADKAAILGIVPDSSVAGMRSLIAQHKYSFPVLIDTGGVASAYKVRYVPNLFVIDAQGNLADTVVGGTDFAKLNKLVDALAGG